MDKREILYTKTKEVTIHLTSKKKLLVTVTHDDFRHKMELLIEYSQPQLIIDDVRCNMKKYPHPGCIDALDALRVMIGEKVKPGIMKKANQLLGGHGCTHLNNLFQEACYSVIQGLGIYRRQDLEQMVPGLSLAQTAKVLIELRPELIDSCISFIPQSDFIQTVEQAVLPENPKITEFIKKHQA